jgi:hypothetical protein
MTCGCTRILSARKRGRRAGASNMSAMSLVPPYIIVSNGGFGELGWDSLVAIGTLVLALVTAWLAWSTRKLARETADDVSSQLRPVLIDSAEGVLVVGYPQDSDQGAFTLAVKNVGPGPALNARAEIFIKYRNDSWTWETGVGTVGPGAAAGGQRIWPVPPIYAEAQPEPDITCEISCVYEDVANGIHRTVFNYTSAAPQRPDLAQILTVRLGLVKTQVPQ